MAHPDVDETNGQDLAETFDETNITPDGEDIATSDMQPDLLDVTAAEDDADEDDARAAADGDFDPDALDEAEYEEVAQADEDLDAARTLPGNDADRVQRGRPHPSDYESPALSDDDLKDLGYAESDSAAAEDAALDEALDESFPASDPPAIDTRRR